MVTETRSSRSTRSLATSTSGLMWPSPGDGMKTSSSCIFFLRLISFCQLIFLTEKNGKVGFAIEPLKDEAIYIIKSCVVCIQNKWRIDSAIIFDVLLNN